MVQQYFWFPLGQINKLIFDQCLLSFKGLFYSTAAFSFVLHFVSFRLNEGVFKEVTLKSSYLKVWGYMAKNSTGAEKYGHWDITTAWKVSKYGVFSGPSEYGGLLCKSVNIRIQSEYRKIRTRKNSIFGHFSRREGNINVKWCH